MGKPNGFLQYKRMENPDRSIEERLKDYMDFHSSLNEEERIKQGARCMNCGVPFCQSAIELKGMVTGCPLHNLIPEWNDEVYKRNYQHALSRLLKTNPFPEFTGRVCPALCEKACINGIDDEPVTIHDNERFIIETAYEKGWMKPKIPAVRSGKKVAVIGSGPSGLACATLLNGRGHEVHVYEREDKMGGLLMYGIPNMKLEKSVIDRREALFKEEGIIFHYNVEAGVDVSLDELSNSYDAIVICTGSKKPRALNAAGIDTQGVYYAVDYLSSQTRHLRTGSDYISAEGKHVIIVGGGDTGNDCTGTALRQHCASVTQIEMMPKAPDTRAASNPWPEWPKISKTDYGQLEAIATFGHDPRIYETTITEIYSEDGHICAVKIQQVYFENGAMKFREGSEQVLECDLLLIAAGFVGIEDHFKEAFQLETTPRNVIATKPNHYQSQSYDNVFAAGDARRGQSLVVWAIAEGKAAAAEVDAYLMGYTNLE
jgi:glutamate synthase (NADPH/NADH) small chain